MKKILYSLIGVVVAVNFASCNLNLAPENTMVDEIVYKSSKSAQSVLLGAYVRLDATLSGIGDQNQGANNSGYLFAAADVGTPNLKIISENENYVSLQNGTFTPQMRDGIVFDNYITCYNTIDVANNIISGINKYGEFEQSLKNQYIAEARFIRAYANLMLLQCYGDGALTGDMNGLGVVIKMTPYESYLPGEKVGRATVQESYDFIISDLKEYAALPDVNPATLNNVRATKTTAMALLSRVYLYRGSYKNDVADLDLAAAYADSVKMSGYYTLANATTINALFPDNVGEKDLTNKQPESKEIIFMQPSWSSLGSMRNSMGRLNYYEKVSAVIDPAFVASIPANDYRGVKRLMFTAGKPGSMTTFKYNNVNGYNAVMYIRYAEVLLNRAEALVRSTKSVNAEAVAIVNEIHNRFYDAADKPADWTVATFATWQTLLQAILKERNIELCFEGHSRWDIIRSGGKLQNETVPANRMIFPIPDSEVKITNGQILQNTGFR